MIFTNWHVSNYGGVLIEGNVFGHLEDASQAFSNAAALDIGSGVGQLDDWDVRHNTFETAPSVASLSGTGSEWKGNLGGGNGCVAAFAYSYNVGETCAGTGDVPVSPAVNTAAHPDQAPFYGDDLHLGTGSAAIGAANPADHPATDLEGHRGSPPTPERTPTCTPRRCGSTPTAAPCTRSAARRRRTSDADRLRAASPAAYGAAALRRH